MMWTKHELTVWSVLYMILLTLPHVSKEEITRQQETVSASGDVDLDKDGHVGSKIGDFEENNNNNHNKGAGRDEGDKNSKQVPIVNTIQGRIRGKLFVVRDNEMVAAYLGVKYAQDPVGQLRFQPPQRTKPWDGVFNATEFGPICYQPGEQKIWDMVYAKNRSIVRKRKLESYHMSEACLTLNIYVPLTENGSFSHKTALPVFFFIHGGSYYMNAGRLYPGQILASTQKIIVVTFNYRLGPLGFLSTADSSAPGNYGLLDQAAALDWIYENIDQFGGNPMAIGLVGNSAGGASVMLHMLSPLSRGKFQVITAQSGCSGAPWAIQHSPRRHAESLAAKLGCPQRSTRDLVDCLRNFTPLQIMKNAKLEDGLSLAYAAVIDGKYGGKFLSAHPEQLIRQNQFQHVPILTGFTRDEVTIWFIEFGPQTSTKDLVSFVQLDVVSLLEDNPSVTSANVAAMIHSVTVQYLYRSGINPENDTTGKTTSVSDFISDVGLKAPCIKEMNLLTKYNTKPVYLYEFNYFSVDDIKMGRREWIGSYHESELQYIFGEAYMNYSNHLRSYDDKKMSDLMMKIWSNFIRHGNPTPKGERMNSLGLKFNWGNYSEVHQDYAVLGLKSHMEKYFLNDRMLFWNFFFPIFRDYPFRYSESSQIKCDDWEAVQTSWIFWLLITTTTLLAFILTVFLTFGLRQRFRHSHPIISNNNSSSRNNSNVNSSRINYRVTQNL